MRYYASEDAEKLLQQRYRILDIWRALIGPVMMHPLAIADSVIFKDKDLVGVEY